MPSAYTQDFYRVVFSAKNRSMLITPHLEARLDPLMGGILREMRDPQQQAQRRHGT